MTNSNSIIYLDNNASTPIEPRVLEVMMPFLKENFANPSSTHHFGVLIKEFVNNARIQVANFIGADVNEITFTSGSTEAINIAIKGVAENYAEKGKHIITVSTEHKAILGVCKHLEKCGFEVTYLSVQNDGRIDLEELKNSLRADTILVSVMYVNNETGVIQPIKEIAEITHQAGAIFMSDTTQAMGKYSINVDELGIDILCLSGHKMYAPKGIGALYVRKGIHIPPQTHGGDHEKGLRSGTLNVPGIIALGETCEILSKEMLQDVIKITNLRNKLEKALLKIPSTSINGSVENRIYNVTNVSFKGIDANVMIGIMKNIAVSNGSACTSAVFEPSHVLTAMGISNDDAFASLRFSLSKFNTEEEINTTIQTITKLIEMFR